MEEHEVAQDPQELPFKIGFLARNIAKAVPLQRTNYDDVLEDIDDAMKRQCRHANMYKVTRPDQNGLISVNWQRLGCTSCEPRTEPESPTSRLSVG